ncbi:uncharacterized protein LOC101853152 isoform X2 [Aplysia californica]|uniref:Uncharacterized protein LOC101853152 isoform X2 n=1 Tax=Aplysia californica TaxID=6500 RepID=A0ABM0JJG4_APLCA|nr:uncharacterized protein LOC101853152 isoform X2 [Aplysia californica]
MNVVASFLFMALLLLAIKAQKAKVEIIGPDRVQEFHACVGTTAYIPWPLNVLLRTGHKSPSISLTFRRRHSEKSNVIARFTERKEFQVETLFRGRLSVSSEMSGIFLKRVSFDDAGMYLAQATLDYGQVWTRSTNLTVHIRPIVIGGRLNLSQTESIAASGGQGHCVSLVCGTLEYAGYPPAQFAWSAPGKTLSGKTTSDDTASSVQVCSPFQGEVTCSLVGFSSVCTYDHVVSLHLDLPGPPANASSVHQSKVTRDLVLMIVMPVLAIALPLTILGIWVLSHLLKSYPQYREHRHYENHDPPVTGDVEGGGPPDQTVLLTGGGGEGDGDHVQNQPHRMASEQDRAEEEEEDNDNRKEDNGDESETDVKNGDIREEEEEEEDDEQSQSSEDENKVNEEQPLMEDSANLPTVNL